MKTLKVGLVQQANGADADENIRRIEENVSACARRGAQLVVLQELQHYPYFCQAEEVAHFDLAASLDEIKQSRFRRMAAEQGVVLVTTCFEKRAPGLYHNTAVVFEPGGVAGIYRKMHIPDDPGYYEKFYFTPGDTGFYPIQTSVGRLGVLICWDQWYPEAARLMTLRGADLLIYPTAIGWSAADDADEQQRQLDAWITVQRAHAVANGLPVIAVNRTGHEPDPSGLTAGTQFWGNSFVAGPQGELLARAAAREEQNLVVEVNLDRSEQVRRWWPFLRDRRIDAYGELSARFLE
ncbi:MAG: carbon-nitrogen hydrolase [Prevotellaceae bacterium]|jgi:N-carbamoylputrescine amidase|nr:carbon-nitrogen hydrolase [Prevotellaceae bacterium]